MTAFEENCRVTRDNIFSVKAPDEPKMLPSRVFAHIHSSIIIQATVHCTLHTIAIHIIIHNYQQQQQKHMSKLPTHRCYVQ